MLAKPIETFSWVFRLLSVGVALSCLESLWSRSDFGRGGMVDLDIQVTRIGPSSRLRAQLSGDTAMRLMSSLTAVRLTAALVLLGGASDFQLARFVAVVLAVSSLGSRWLSGLGTHAAGALTTSTVTAGALGAVIGTNRAVGLALAFIAGQSALAYMASGLSKLAQPEWRRGSALHTNATTMMWGRRRSAAWLDRYRFVGIALCWTTMVGECLIPLALLAPPPIALALLGFGALFHMAVAIEMGLNSFLWAFVATYPAVLWCNHWLHHAAHL